jgi:transcriptional regulator with XRE-family HTH domain
MYYICFEFGYNKIFNQHNMKDLKTYRVLKGWSQTDLAQVARIHPQTVFNLENGKVEPNEVTRKALEGALGVRVNWLATLGANGGVEQEWEKNEEDLRNLLANAKALLPDERLEFLSVCREYLETLEAILQLEEYEALNAPLLPPDVYFSLKQRVKGS